MNTTDPGTRATAAPIFRGVFCALCGALAVLGVSAGAGAQTTFTGTITYRARSARGAEATLTEAKRAHSVRLDVRDSANGADLIYDEPRDIAYVVFPRNRAYVRLTHAELDSLAADIEGRVTARHPQAVRSQTLSLARTDSTRSVAGVTCRVYNVTGTEGGRPIADQVCLAQGIGLSPYDLPEQGLLAGGLGQRGWLAVVRDTLRGGRGVLSVQRTRGGSGQPSFELEATRIDRTPPPDSLFVPPTNYRALTIQQALGEELERARRSRAGTG